MFHYVILAFIYIYYDPHNFFPLKLFQFPFHYTEGKLLYTKSPILYIFYSRGSVFRETKVIAYNEYPEIKRLSNKHLYYQPKTSSRRTVCLSRQHHHYCSQCMYTEKEINHNPLIFQSYKSLNSHERKRMKCNKV